MIEAETLTKMVTTIAEAEDRDVSKLVQALREAHPGVTVSSCLDDEVCNVDPLVETPGINVYLLSTSSKGCQSLTRDPVSANGIVLAEVEEHEEHGGCGF